MKSALSMIAAAKEEAKSLGLKGVVIGLSIAETIISVQGMLDEANANLASSINAIEEKVDLNEKKQTKSAKKSKDTNRKFVTVKETIFQRKDGSVVVLPERRRLQARGYKMKMTPHLLEIRRISLAKANAVRMANAAKRREEREKEKNK